MKFRRAPLPFLAALCLLTSALCLRAADWPQLLGPNRDGIYSGKDLAAAWPKGGPRVLWQKKIGQGFAAPVVAQGKLILFTRVGDAETVEALDAKDGKPLWKFEYPTAYRDNFGFDPGPRGTPTVADGKVFTFGADGALTCTALADGKKIWSVDCKKEFAAPQGFFGLACSPLVEGKAVIVDVGGARSSSSARAEPELRAPNGGAACLVAFDRETGKILWHSFSDEPSYSSPVAATLGGKRHILALTRGHFIGLDPADGKILFEQPFRPPVQASVTGALPTVAGDNIFISAAYDLGGLLMRMTNGRPAKVWASDEDLSLQFTTAVHRDGLLYGLHGRHDIGGTELRCVEMGTGQVRWGKPGLAGANVLLAGDSLLVLTENGELIRAAASPDGYHETARAQILGRGVRAHAALADGLFYARDKGQLVCVDLR
ncbi:MAG: PQQ-binding-like beta-propeller repeat protein [Verrucomicrobia bacterium]|nr:PQQ-binding-like beta-propeller repeat protein [Verrucomicrobiota bacterium]